MKLKLSWTERQALTWSLFRSAGHRAVWQCDQRPNVFTATGATDSQVYLPLGPMRIPGGRVVAPKTSQGINYLKPKLTFCADALRLAGIRIAP